VSGATFDFVGRRIRSLFHGTSEDLQGPLRPGAYDGVFWTAEHSAVAQCYIPAAGGRTYCHVSSYQAKMGVRPSNTDPFYSIAREIGPAAYDVEYDQFGCAKSWRMPGGYLTYADVARHIEVVLGYKNKGRHGDLQYELLSDGWDNDRGHLVVPASYKRPGSLVIVTGGFDQMRLANLSTGESDLTDLQYHRIETFRRLESEGFDGVVIDDFCQSKAWGNVGHRSIGFFGAAVTKLETVILPAVRFDWGESAGALQQTDTPEYVRWAAERIGAEDGAPPLRERMRV